jgi:glycosyltransferase involved in cell wall biosynthesis
MRILLDATPYTPDRPTGAGRLVQHLVAHLFELDSLNRYHLFGFAPQLWPHTRLPENFTYERITPWRWLGPLAQEAARRNYIAAQLSRHEFDVVHCTLEMTPVYDERTRVLFSLYDLARRSPHFRDSTPQSPRTRARTWLRYRLARRADLIHTISRDAAEHIAETLDIPRRRIRVVYPGIDPLFSPGEPDADVLARRGLSAGQYFLFVGQLGRQKNEDGLLRAFAALHRDGNAHGADLALVGDTSQMSPTTGQLLGGELAGRTRLIADATDRDLLHLYRGAIALVLPSFHEGFGLPVAEAMACGTPAIVSSATSLPEVVGDGGLTVSVGNDAELAEAMHRLRRDPELAASLSRRAVTQAERFSQANYAKGLLALYQEMGRG